ncbi:Fc.00g041080.m01.CDS01 [Cosmosporella sp. VM-42]
MFIEFPNIDYGIITLSDEMAGLEPDFKIRVWKYTYADVSGAGTIFLHSPQETEDKNNGTLILRQVNSEAENKVWIQENAVQLFKRSMQGPPEGFLDEAHGVIIRDGQGKTLPGQNDKFAIHQYKRGDRIWVERSLVPTRDIDKNDNMIPVINLEKLVLFEIPFDYICFVPQFTKTDGAGVQYAACPGSVLNTFLSKRKTKARIYFHWSADKPGKVSYMWLNKKDKDESKTMDAFSQIERPEQRRQAFRNHWLALTKKYAELGLLIGDEILQGGADRFESSSDSSDEELTLHWRPGPITQQNCCNLSPCPSKNDPDLDLVPTYIGGYRCMEHYHVQDDDLDECPRGPAHKGHCVLRDNRTRCAYAVDRVPHTCCKLRENPLLPGPYGDPEDARLPLWETRASDDYFIDASKNVRTRKELEDRDEIPPQMMRLRQEMLKEAEAGRQKEDQQEAQQQEEQPERQEQRRQVQQRQQEQEHEDFVEDSEEESEGLSGLESKGESSPSVTDVEMTTEESTPDQPPSIQAVIARAVETPNTDSPWLSQTASVPLTNLLEQPEYMSYMDQSSNISGPILDTMGSAYVFPPGMVFSQSFGQSLQTFDSSFHLPMPNIGLTTTMGSSADIHSTMNMGPVIDIPSTSSMPSLSNMPPMVNIPSTMNVPSTFQTMPSVANIPPMVGNTDWNSFDHAQHYAFHAFPAAGNVNLVPPASSTTPSSPSDRPNPFSAPPRGLRQRPFRDNDC